MGGWKLPVTVRTAGGEFAIRSDFRAVLDALAALNDTSMSEQERAESFLMIMYPGYKQLPDPAAAFSAAMEFVNLGKASVPEKGHKPQLVHWDKDVDILAPAIDKVLGYSCRRCEYLHWWEFIGAYYGIGDGLFAQVVNIRSKRAKGKKLEKHEQQFARDNADLIGPAAVITAEEEAFFKSLGV